MRDVEQISPDDLHPENRLFVDYVAARPEAHALLPADADVQSARRPPAAHSVVDALAAYHDRLGASQASRSNVDALRVEGTACVIGGHQAVFLGGPALIAYKILTVVRAARALAERLSIRVVPIFWLATEDHDVGEIHHVRFLDPDGRLKTAQFDWIGDHRPIEALPITDAVRNALDEAIASLQGPASDALISLLTPDPEDDYGSWHAKIWLRLFAEQGLVLVEPRTVRPFAQPVLREAIRRRADVREALRRGADAVRGAGYDPTLDPDRVGRPFLLDDQGRRRRLPERLGESSSAPREAEILTSDAALRPILADRLFPTIASVLGPSELAYHAQLGPLYDVLDAHRPQVLPRSGYTLLSAGEAELLNRLHVRASEVVRGSFDADHALRRATSPQLRMVFDETRARVRDALAPLLPELEDLDPGLRARWNQTADRAAKGLDDLEARAQRADLARSGLSTKEVHRLQRSLRPTGRPQERVLSYAHFASLHGVRWLTELPEASPLDGFAHQVVVFEGVA